MSQESLKGAVEANDSVQEASLRKKISVLASQKWMCDYYDKIDELARRFTEWSFRSGVSLAQSRQVIGVSRYASSRVFKEDDLSLSKDEHADQTLVICTGGGPGFMEAANKGAARVPRARTMGVSATWTCV